LTYLAARRGRGIDAIVDIGVLGGYTGTIVHDGLATYDVDELKGGQPRPVRRPPAPIPRRAGQEPDAVGVDSGHARRAHRRQDRL
ncbi:MAG: hypothetical protein ACRDOE_02290, partial [Streptosporangiaceae bacterium]